MRQWLQADEVRLETIPMLNRISNLILRRPFTIAALREAADKYIANPPVTAEFRDMLATLKGQTNCSFLDSWRDEFDHILSNISEGPSWGAQRANLLKKMLIETSWLSGYTVSRECRHVDSWKYFLPANFHDGRITDQQLSFLLLQRFLQALISFGVLQMVGQTCYWVSTTKLTELDLYKEMDIEIKRFVTKASDVVLDFADQGDEFAVSDVARIRAEYLDPISRELIDELSFVEEELVHSSVDVHKLRSSRQRVGAKKQRVAQILQQMGSTRATEDENWLRKYLPPDI